MRNRLLLIALPLCAVMLAAGVAVASPDGGEHFKDTKLDDPHVERPIAASARTSPTASSSADHDLLFTEHFLAAQAAVIAPPPAPATEPPPEPEPEPEPEPAPVWRPAPPPIEAGEPSDGDFFSCIRQRESGGDYGVTSRNGLYHGAYQFLQSTWDSTAASVGRDDLIGVDPASASPSDQDAMAGALYAQSGSRPWGGYCD